MMAFSTSADCGRITSSRSGQYATGVSSAATRFTGASRYSKSSSAMRAAISAPKPHVSWSSCATIDAVGLLHCLGDAVPVVGHDGAKVDHHRADAVLLGLLRREQGSLHQRAIGEDDDIGAFAADRGLAERDHVLGARILALVVGLAVQVLVLEEQHRIVAADRGAEQARSVLRVRREHDADAGAVREDALAGLAVIRRAAAQVSADRRRGRPSGTRTRCSSDSASSTSRCEAASSPARCSRRTGSRRPA